jgi:quinolinate synthase
MQGIDVYTDRVKALTDKIETLKKQRNAILLAHNYQPAEIQDCADFLGDSLELSQKAAQTDAEVIVFCGVHFMAETASILCPDKVVLLPNVAAGCPMANMINADQLREVKKSHPGALVVTYVNSTAAVKAESDCCCTSGNALKVVDALKNNGDIIFVPDKYLGSFVAGRTGKPMILWPGYCPTHIKILPEDIQETKSKHPAAVVMVHPECHTEVAKMADVVLSTGGMLKYPAQADAQEFIVGTETGMVYRLGKLYQDKTFIPLTQRAVCPNMKVITLEQVLAALQEMSPEVKVPKNVRERAYAPVKRMLEIV